MQTPSDGTHNPRPAWITGKLMTAAEMARMGGLARTNAHSNAKIRAWGRQGGRPGKLDRKALGRLAKLLASVKSQAECAAMLGVSLRTIGRLVARLNGGRSRMQWKARG